MKRVIPLILALSIGAGASQASAENLLGGLLKEKAGGLVDKALSGDLKLPSGGKSAGGASGYQTYGLWQFKVNELKVGVDEQWQAVIGIKNDAPHRQGMVASEIKVFLITEDGETLANWGELYKASVEGSSSGLEPLPGTLWLEPGDEARIRVRFADSRNIKPVKIRLQSTGATAQIRTFPVN